MDSTRGRKPTRLVRHRDGREGEVWDWLAEEAPLEIRARYLQVRPGQLVEEPIVVTMRTPGHDRELALGLLLAEGLIEGPAAVARWETQTVEGGGTRLTFDLAAPPRRPLSDRQRGLYANTSCGVCGKSALNKVHLPPAPDLDPLGPVFTTTQLQGLPDALRAQQRNFDETGGLHAAALFGPEGLIAPVFEDVGRHNAVDKLLGHAAAGGQWPLREAGLLLSGRVSFELMQKAAVAGIPLIAAIGAPSSLAVELAQHFGQTLVGFLRADRYNVYTHPQRIESK